ncbi:MAG: replication-associated recombination protein A [Candidatus Sericytochromatia bacterium]|nr:replication-associated recombination protein A [Candidatus Sericytochromatia bacterium]
MSQDLPLPLFPADGGPGAPLAHRMRPRTPAEFVGQGHLLGQGRLLERVVAARRLPSLLLWGPPGSGKTTLARLIAAERRSHLVTFSAVTQGVPELRRILTDAEARQRQGVETLLFVDEIHRFHKGQQDTFLPFVEQGSVVLLGATTENPSFELNAALLSRVRVLPLQALDEAAMTRIVRRALTDRERGLGRPEGDLTADALALLVELAAGDARAALNGLEDAAHLLAGGEGGGSTIDVAQVAEAMQRGAAFDRAGEHHYDTVSALIKSLRGSDPDAALLWLARMLNRGDDPVFVARRLVIFASEDIGNADPQALSLAVSAAQAVQLLGLPEAQYPLWQATLYLALAPKSNSVKRAGQASLAYEAAHPGLRVPLHLRNAPTRLLARLGNAEGYQDPHLGEGGWVAQDYWPLEAEPQTFYTPCPRGFEAQHEVRLNALRAGRSPDAPPPQGSLTS